MTPISERLREHARSAATPINCRLASAEAADIIDALVEALESVRMRGLPDRYKSDVVLAELVDAAIARARGAA